MKIASKNYLLLCIVIYKKVLLVMKLISSILPIKMFFSFRHVPRKLVHQVDQLANRARLFKQQYVITWFSV